MQNLLKEGLGTVVEKTSLTRKLTIDGVTKAYPVYRVRLDQLFYNDQNDRIATWISQYKSENGADSFSELDRASYNAIIEQFIIQSNEAAIEKTQMNIQLVHQREPGVILADGRVIDGNRRFTCLRRLALNDEEFNWFETVILDTDIENGKKQIKMLELAIQHGEEKKVDYNPIDRLVGVYQDNGHVIIKGKLEQEAQAPNVQEESPLSATDFPLVLDLGLDKYVTGWEKMNERIEHISADDELTLKKVSKDGEVTFEVLNMRGEKIGNLYFDRAKGLAKLLKNVKATVATVTPLSQRRKGSKYAAMTIRLDYVGGDNKTAKKASTTLGDYEQTRVASWPAVVKIKSVFDAVVGATNDGKLFVDGFCPCSEADLMRIMGLNE